MDKESVQADSARSDLHLWKWRVPRDVGTAVALIGLVGALGGWATEIGPWYFALHQPPWKPPDLLFGPAWMLIYILTAWAAVRAWRGSRTKQRSWLWTAWTLNGVLNVLWSVLFFSLRRPDWALIEGVMLWLSIVIMTAVMQRVDRRAVILLLPYAVWVGVAVLMNRAVVQLNGPFGAVG